MITVIAGLLLVVLRLSAARAAGARRALPAVVAAYVCVYICIYIYIYA